MFECLPRKGRGGSGHPGRENGVLSDRQEGITLPVGLIRHTCSPSAITWIVGVYEPGQESAAVTTAHICTPSAAGVIHATEMMAKQLLEKELSSTLEIHNAEPQEHRTPGTQNPRNTEPQEHRTPGTQNPRNTEPEEHRT
ncbi:unnamed protein product [Gadus morhua 'NCC']